MNDEMERGAVLDMRRKTDVPGAMEIGHMDDKIELVKALIEAEARNAESAKQAIHALIESERRASEAYQETADRRLAHLEETQTKILRRVLMWAGGLLVLGVVVGTLMFVLEFIGPMAIRQLIKGVP